MGPSAIRYAGLEARLNEIGVPTVDLGNVGTPVAEAVTPGDEQVRFLPQIKKTCEQIAGLVVGALEEGCRPLVLGGDHSVALGGRATARSRLPLAVGAAVGPSSLGP